MQTALTTRAVSLLDLPIHGFPYVVIGEIPRKFTVIQHYAGFDGLPQNILLAPDQSINGSVLVT